MVRNGTHTWDLNLRYHICPKCDKIIESREPFYYSAGEYSKDLSCPRCHHHFTESKPLKTIGPLFGTPQPVEWDWR